MATPPPARLGRWLGALALAVVVTACSAGGAGGGSDSGGGGGGNGGGGGGGNGGGAASPLGASADGRRLVDDSGAVLILGDSPQALVVNVSTADANSYFSTRASQGFNAAWVNVLCETYTGGRSDATTYDGIAPFTAKLANGAYDLRAPNEAYFARVDALVAAAASHGIWLWLDPIETGGFLPTLRANGESSAREYGRFLGQRYRNADHIVWMSGNDFYTWSDPGDSSLALEVARGIRDEDTRHLQTTLLESNVSSLDSAGWVGLLGINGSYTYAQPYVQLYEDWARSPHLPNVLTESNYEGEQNLGPPVTVAADCRNQLWWSMLAGAAGSFYGNHWVWPLDPAWAAHMHDPGAEGVKYVRAILSPRRWQDLVPDTDHVVATSGFGTQGADDYVTTARVPDGSLVIAYFPVPHDLVIDMTTLSGAATASWYDPTTGAKSNDSASPVPNTGTHVFTPPGGTHSDGAADWVLVLETR